MEVKNCSQCKKPIHEKLSFEILVCSANCYNRFNWKVERDQLILGCAFGLFLLWLAVSNNNAMGAAVTSAITMAFVIHKIRVMKEDYPWRD